MPSTLTLSWASALRFGRRCPAGLAGAIALTLAGCAGPGPDASQVQSLSGHLNEWAARSHVCAVALAQIRNRQLDRVDTASTCDASQGVRADTLFQAASLGKPVFAYAVLKLVQQGRLDLDAPLMRYLPQGYRHRYQPLKAEPSEWVTDVRIQGLTARQALQHTTGLPNWASGPLRFEAEPGARWSYSGEGFVLLQRAVEAITGQALDLFMNEQVFVPLGMQHSAYAWDEAMAPDFLPGTKANGSPRKTLKLTTPFAAFTLYTSAADYARFLVALLNDQPLLVTSLASPVEVDRHLNLAWGLGWGLERSAEGFTLWHWGNNPGYRAFVMARPASGDGFVMLTNSENGLALAEPIAQQVMPGEHRVFRFAMLEGDTFQWLCTRLGVCL